MRTLPERRAGENATLSSEDSVGVGVGAGGVGVGAGGGGGVGAGGGVGVGVVDGFPVPDGTGVPKEAAAPSSWSVELVSDSSHAPAKTASEELSNQIRLRLRLRYLRARTTLPCEKGLNTTNLRTPLFPCSSRLADSPAPDWHARGTPLHVYTKTPPRGHKMFSQFCQGLKENEAALLFRVRGSMEATGTRQV